MTAPPQSEHGASSLLHRQLRRLTSLFGGNYLKVGEGNPLEVDAWELTQGEVQLTGLEWRGPGEPILLLHGLCTNAWSWARVASLLRDKHHAVALSSRGHGASSALVTGYQLEQTTSDVCAVIEQVVQGPVHLAGHSWGGKVACHVAATHPELVRSLVLADPVPPWGFNLVLRAVPSVVKSTFRAERGPFPSREHWEQAAQSVAFLKRWDAVDQLLWEASFEVQEDGSYHHRLPQSAFEEIIEGPLAQDISPLLSQIRCPVLLLRPTLTVSFLPLEMRRLRKHLHSLVEKRVRGDHSFIHTNPIDTAAALERFLEQAASQSAVDKEAMP